MANDLDEIVLSDEDRRVLAIAADETGKPWRRLLREAIGSIRITSASKGDSGHQSTREVSDERVESAKKFFAELAKRPCNEPPNDGLVASRDHDKILYGRE